MGVTLVNTCFKMCRWRIFCVAANILACCGLSYACPRFVEFFADPVEVSDQEGEFVEIYTPDSLADSLYIQFEDKAAFALPYPRKSRLVLVHDTAICSQTVDSAAVACHVLPVALPNSRESFWRLWVGASGECRDSVYIPRPKPGKSLVRVKETDEWEPDEPSLGGVLEDAPGLALDDGDLRFTEIHHCPLEPEPEWVEVYNATNRSFMLSEFRFCERGSSWGKFGAGAKGDSIAPFESIVLTRDTLLLREYLGFSEVRLVQVSMGYLNNSAGSLSICMGERVIDSVSWDKKTVQCPSGFNPQSGRAENTPGFQGNRAVRSKGNRDSGEAGPFKFKLSSRILRRGGAPLRVYVESEFEVSLRLLDSVGRTQWGKTLPAHSSGWVVVPLDGLNKVGVAYVVIGVGRYEKRVGFVLRP